MEEKNDIFKFCFFCHICKRFKPHSNEIKWKESHFYATNPDNVLHCIIEVCVENINSRYNFDLKYDNEECKEAFRKDKRYTCCLACWEEVVEHLENQLSHELSKGVAEEVLNEE